MILYTIAPEQNFLTFSGVAGTLEEGKKISHGKSSVKSLLTDSGDTFVTMSTINGSTASYAYDEVENPTTPGVAFIDLAAFRTYLLDNLIPISTGGTSYTFSEGLTESGGAVSFGGTATSARTLTMNGNSFSVQNEGGYGIGTGFNQSINSVGAQSDGKTLYTGNFTSCNGESYNRIIRLNTNGSVDTSLVVGTGLNTTGYTVGALTDGRIIVGGNFVTYGGASSIRIAVLSSTGTLDTSFVTGTGFDARPVGFINISGGRVLVYGNFTTYNGTSSPGMVLLDSNGAIDNSLNVGTGFTGGSPISVVVQPDGKYIAVGNFTGYNGTGANRIIRLNSDGTVDGSFVIGTGFDLTAKGLALQTDGRVIVGGYWSDYNGTARNRIIRLEANGSVDATFVVGTGLDANPNQILLQADGNVVMGGNFTTYNGTTVGRVVRVSTTGALDTAYLANTGTGFDSTVEAMALVGTDIVYVGGFIALNSVTANRAIRLKSDGTTDSFVTSDTSFGPAGISYTTDLSSANASNPRWLTDKSFVETVSAKTAVPSTATSPGTAGEIRTGAGFIYVCTATDVWQRVAIATW